ncbi:MAG: YkgJ family cysteine cluster protein [Chromatiales bacterium]|nr:YkgJ family cysteine cluster protein [Chromatiales bacterium]
MSSKNENKCQKCTAKCCSYVSQQIDTPRSIAAFDFLLWQLSHKEIQLYKDEDGWFLLINNRCTHIQDDGSCGIYEVRPQICRDHSNDYCEYDSPAEEGFELFFDGYESLDNYCRKRFKKWDKRFKKPKK